MTLYKNSVPGGNWPNNTGLRAPYSLSQEWGKIWSYRRVYNNGGSIEEPASGDISNQNWGSGNDYKRGYLFLSMNRTLAQREDWYGRLDSNSLAEAELRAYGWYWYYKVHAPAHLNQRLSLDTAFISETQTGLSKIPYIRGMRKSVGNARFVLMKMDMTANQKSRFGTNFTDSISHGDYFSADVHGMLGCAYPHYVNDSHIVPFTIPFRALTNKNFDNLIVAGKTMAQTFTASAATRLHPMEWSTGLAAGLSAVIMSEQDISTADISNQHIPELQSRIKKYMPIYWPDTP